MVGCRFSGIGKVVLIRYLSIVGGQGWCAISEIKKARWGRAFENSRDSYLRLMSAHVVVNLPAGSTGVARGRISAKKLC